MDNKFAKGIYFNKLSPETPDSIKKWKKGGISVQPEKLVEYLNAIMDKKNERGYINFDLVENEKDGKKFLSFKLNEWKKPETLEKKDDEVIDLPW